MRGLDLCRRAAGQFLLPRRGKCIAFSRGKRLCPAASNQRPAFSAAYSTSELRQGFDSAGSGSDVYVSGDWTTEHARASLVGRVVVGTVMFVARCVRAEALWLSSWLEDEYVQQWTSRCRRSRRQQTHQRSTSSHPGGTCWRRCRDGNARAAAPAACPQGLVVAGCSHRRLESRPRRLTSYRVYQSA